MPVEKTASPNVSPTAPYASPLNVRPSSSTNIAVLTESPFLHRHTVTVSTSAPRSTVSRPRSRVATTRAGNVRPAYGVLRDFEASAAGSTVHEPAGSTSVRLAGAPA